MDTPIILGSLFYSFKKYDKGKSKSNNGKTDNITHVLISYLLCFGEFKAFDEFTWQIKRFFM